MQRRNRVRPARESQGEHCHAEKLVRIRWIFASEAEQAVGRKPESFAQRSDVLFYKTGIEAVVAGRHRSMGGEYDFSGDTRHRGVEGKAFVFHAHVDCL